MYCLSDGITFVLYIGLGTYLNTQVLPKLRKSSSKDKKALYYFYRHLPFLYRLLAP